MNDNMLPTLNVVPSDDILTLWLQMEIADGNPSPDTINTYRLNLNHWFTWCRVNRLDYTQIKKQHIEAYRRELVSAGLLASTIGVKLSVVRQFYKSALSRGMISANPVIDVRPPKDRRVIDKKKHLTDKQANSLLDALPPCDGSLKSFRDRAIVAMMLFQGLRRVEITRANTEDLQKTHNGDRRILVHGKGRDRLVYPREDTLALIDEYLSERAKRGGMASEEVLIHQRNEVVTPLFVHLSKSGKPLKRITRNGVNSIIDGYFRVAGVKSEGISCHALRHSCGYMLYRETKDIRAVSDALGHLNIQTSAIYAASDEDVKRHTEKIPLKMR